VPGDDVAVDALRFLGKPLDEGRRIRDFAFRFREWFALLGGHDDGEVIHVGEHEVEPLAHDLRAFPRGFFRPGGHRCVRGFDGPPGFRGTHLRHAA
jgi:hypothetical protein